jgi:peptide/nickel transport system substrate-binding protein
MFKNWKIILAIFVILLLTINLTGLAQDQIVIALQGEPTTLDPQFADDGNMRPVSDNVFDKLLVLDGKTLQPIPCLAIEWERVSDITWQFTLRENVKFHNGEPFTAEDAVYSVKRIIDPTFNSQIAGNFSTIKDAKIINSNTILIITNGPDPILLKRLTLLDIVNKKYTESSPNNIINTKPVGTGPYQVIEWNRGEEIKIEKFNDYWGQKPNIQNVTYRFIQENSTRLAALKAGEINLAVNMLPEYLEQLPSYKTANSIEFYFLRFNTIRGIMQNKLIRQAVNYAIDKEAIVEALFLGSAIPARGQLAKEAYFGFNKNLDAYAFNPEKAKELLKEAGYKGEVVQLISERGRWMKDGEISEAVASMISDVGINVKLTFLSWQQWLDTLFNLEKAPDIMFSSNGNELFDMDRFYQAIIKTGGPQSAYSNPDIDKKIDAARNEMDPVKRQAMYEELAQLVYDDPFGVPLINLKSIWGISKDLEWEPREDGRMLISEMSLK